MGLPLLLTVGLYWHYHPRPITKNAAYANTTIFLTASSSTVLFPGDCIQMRWNVAYAQRVLANEELSPAVGEKTLCINTLSQPTLQVMLMDGSEVTVTQPITILVTQPMFVTVVFIALALLCLGFSDFLWQAGREASRLLTVRAIARAGCAIVLAVGITLVIIEIALSTYFSAAGSREQKIMYLYSLKEIRELQSNIIPVPYVSYVPDPAYEGHNALGYRGPEIAIPKPQGTFRIVAMGGSTTYSTGTTEEESYPAFLQSILRDDYGYSNVEVINAGVSGYTSWEVLSSFVFRVLELEPDMLIFYGALNDLTVREWLSSDCYRGLNPQRGLNGHRGLFVERNAELPASALYRLVAISFDWMSNPLALDSSFEPSRVQCERDPGDTTLEKRLVANTPIYFERNIRNLMTLALAHNVQPVVSSWIYNVEADRPQLWRESIAQHNAVTRQIATDMDIPYINLTEDFPVNNNYWELDGVHLVAAGTYEQARRYAAFLDDSGLLPKADIMVNERE
ncbi:MAG: SGNH/GDSL hydrolase family protein [Chloroflexi bacterium]|nr:SGNH/GDSL hydrolase family protein [Chloroflexota bacterium]